LKLLSVVGARPQFIKAAVLSRALRQRWHEVLVHTGQHYDDLMSDVFFRELGLPQPDVNLGVGSASHAVQTARMLEGLEVVYERERPDLVIVYGDTNSTLAGALGAAKLRIPVAHVEAGFRTYERDLPEEINRVLTDHVAAYLFCATEGAVKALSREGITANAHFTGDLMYDSLLAALPQAQSIEAEVLMRHGVMATDSPSPETPALSDETPATSSLSLEGEGRGEGDFRSSPSSFLRGTESAPGRDILSSPKASVEGSPQPYYLATIHRAATTDDPATLARVLDAFSGLDLPVILPLHPRTAAAMRRAGLETPANVRAVEPVGYFEMLALERNARAILTDSGGVRREAYWLSVPCVTLRAESEWPETVQTGWDALAGTEPKAIVEAARRPRPETPPPPLFGDGHAAAKIVEILQHDPPHGRS
jgi:UDP-N-acetylglucosamine 2-epimerase